MEKALWKELQTKLGIDMHRNAKIVLIMALALIAMAAIIVLATSLPHPMSTPQTYLIVQGNLTIEADSYRAYNFTLPTDISQSQVTGSFGVSQTNPLNIRVFVWDNAAFTSWQTGHATGGIISFYDSGQVTNGTIEAPLNLGGTYWLLFLNNQTVPVDVTVQVYYWYLIHQIERVNQ